MAERVDVIDAPDLPEPDMAALQEAQDEQRDKVLIDSEMDFEEATDRLKAHSERHVRSTRRRR